MTNLFMRIRNKVEKHSDDYREPIYKFWLNHEVMSPLFQNDQNTSGKPMQSQRWMGFRRESVILILVRS